MVIRMADAPLRRQRLVEALLDRGHCAGPQLAAELGVTARTLRADVGRLRRQGYSIVAVPGPGGGYRLGRARAVTPLFLRGDEATAVAVGLAMAAGSAGQDLGESALRALIKVHQMLPSHLAHRATVIAQHRSMGHPAKVHGEILSFLGACSRDRERISVWYDREDGQRRRFDLHALQVSNVDGDWYLLGRLMSGRLVSFRVPGIRRARRPGKLHRRRWAHGRRWLGRPDELAVTPMAVSPMEVNPMDVLVDLDGHDSGVPMRDLTLTS